MSQCRSCPAAWVVVSLVLVSLSHADSSGGSVAPFEERSPARAPDDTIATTNDKGPDSPADTAHGSSAAQTVQQLSDMVVRARRPASDKASVTRIDAAQFRGLYLDLPSVLEQVSGVTVRRTGGFGEYAAASIRGSSPQQVQVYLDGIPLNCAAGGAVDLSKISLNALQEITVYKGTAPIELMGNSAGGVINLSTRPHAEMIEGIVELGSYGYHKAGILAHRRFGAVGNLLSVDYTDADNDYAFDYDNGTPYNPDDDSRRNKKNNAYTLFTTRYANDWTIGARDQLTSLISFSKDRKEYSHKHLTDTVQQTSREATYLQGFVRWQRELSRRGYLGARLEGLYERRLFSDPLGLYYIGGRREEQEILPYLALRVDGMCRAGDVLTLQGVLKASYEGYTSENLLASPTSDPPFARRLSGAAALEAAARWEPLHLTLRYNHVYASDSANFRPNHGSGNPLPRCYGRHYPNANLDALWFARDWLTLDCSIRHEVLPISLADRYGWGQDYMGNPNLRSERHTEAGVGAAARMEHIQSSVAAFLGYTRDVIEVKTNSQKTIMAQNTGDMRFCGAEWDLRILLGEFLVLDNHLTYTYRLKRSESAEWEDAQTPLYYSPIEYDLRLTLSVGHWRLGHNASYQSPYWKGYTVATDLESPLPKMDAYVSVDLFDVVTLTYRIENYLDESVEPFPHYTPLPGRMHFFGGRVTF